jgi:hypothetical protein
MLDAADGIEADTFRDLMRQAAMPAAEADTPVTDWVAQNMPAAQSGAIDWIRFGQLLRNRLGWDWYPDEPQ